MNDVALSVEMEPESSVAHPATGAETGEKRSR